MLREYLHALTLGMEVVTWHSLAVGGVFPTERAADPRGR